MIQASTLNALMLGNFDETVPTVKLSGVGDIEQLKKALEPYVEDNRNVFYVLKATGLFKTMHVRSCFASEKPYPTLSEVAENQREFHFENTKGDVIAVWCPQYVNGINLPGWHFHYLSHDKTQGGHILGLSADELSAKTAAVEGVKK